MARRDRPTGSTSPAIGRRGDADLVLGGLVGDVGGVVAVHRDGRVGVVAAAVGDPADGPVQTVVPADHDRRARALQLAVVAAEVRHVDEAVRSDLQVTVQTCAPTDLRELLLVEDVYRHALRERPAAVDAAGAGGLRDHLRAVVNRAALVGRRARGGVDGGPRDVGLVVEVGTGSAAGGALLDCRSRRRRRWSRRRCTEGAAGRRRCARW